MKIDRKKTGAFLGTLIAIALALYLTYDILLTNIFGLYYCKIAPSHPKTRILKKVQYPLSIYWEDNVYPGFSKEDRELMIINYLDGEHLKTMALNAPDGKHVYLYRLDRPILKELKQKYSTKTWYDKGLKEYARLVMQSEKIYTKATMPKTNYTVTFNEVKLPDFVRKFLYSDETKVIENNTGEVIAYNRRIMRFFYKLLPDFVGYRYYYPHAVCGESHLYYDGKGFGYMGFYGSLKHKVGLNNHLYEKYIKGEK